MTAKHAGREEEREAPVASSQGISSPTEELEALRLERDEQIAAHQRTAADFANFRRRTIEEREREAGLAAEGLLMKLLAVADDLDRAMASLPEQLREEPWVEGIGAIHRKLLALLESEEVRPYDSVGAAFDPREHEAVARRTESGKPAGEVLEEHRKGWRIRDRVLRPAVVSVATD
ncbi:MAG: nucleotide exchange factor GrpE [Candidatus Limnocylindrus sp.]|jgi:molecular chaperone GrpE